MWERHTSGTRDELANYHGIFMQMTYEAMMSFADKWIAAWNRRDIEGVLKHFAEEAEFVSPVARNFVGRPVLRNKQQLREYWRAALDRISVLEFTLDHAAWDEKRRELNVVYEANLNGDRKRACEIMLFDASGRQIRGEALYGAAI
jgi:ketosteroid isomerase-like protein